MYRIGEFSKITGLTTQTLRYYDSEKILSPSYRNEENGYRYYSADDIETAQYISLLRKFNFSIMEIKDVLSNMRTQEDFNDFINEKIVLTENLIIQHKSVIDEMKSYLSLTPLEKKEVENMKYEVNITELSSQLVASIRFKGKYCEICEYFTKVFECADEKVCGIPFTCYYNLEFAETADIEVCVPVSSSVFGNGIQTKTIEGVRTIGVKHIGAYENLGMAYKSLFDYANENNLDYIPPIIEFYDKSMGYTIKGNPDKYETRIYLPIKK